MKKLNVSIYFWFLRAGVGNDFRRVAQKRDAGASRMGSHTGVWEPENIDEDDETVYILQARGHY